MTAQHTITLVIIFRLIIKKTMTEQHFIGQEPKK